LLNLKCFDSPRKLEWLVIWNGGNICIVIWAQTYIHFPNLILWKKNNHGTNFLDKRTCSAGIVAAEFGWLYSIKSASKKQPHIQISPFPLAEFSPFPPAEQVQNNIGSFFFQKENNIYQWAWDSIVFRQSTDRWCCGGTYFWCGAPSMDVFMCNLSSKDLQ
jgi:hypothetical protein